MKKTHSVAAAAASHFMPYIAIIITCRRRNPFSNNNWIWWWWCSSSASLVQRERERWNCTQREEEEWLLLPPQAFHKTRFIPSGGSLLQRVQLCLCCYNRSHFFFCAVIYNNGSTWTVWNPLYSRNDFLPSELLRLDDGMNEFRCIRFLISNLSIIKHCWIYYGKSLLFSFHIRRLYDPTNSLINQHTIRLAVYTYTYKGCIIIISEQRRCM